MKDDELAKIIGEVVNAAHEPLETTEVHAKVAEAAAKRVKSGVTRDLLMYRLSNLRGEGVIHGKKVGPSKGVWIWWGKHVGGKDEG
jgi:hypothetical protein